MKVNYMNNHKYTLTFYDMQWNAFKENEIGTYYLLNGSLKKSNFVDKGDDVDYSKSTLREELNSGKLAESLRSEFGDRLVTIATNLVALNGEDDFGVVCGDILAIPTLDLYRECRKSIIDIDETWWLATPTSSRVKGRDDRLCLLYIDRKGNVCWINLGATWSSNGVRPYFILKHK